MQRGHMLSGWTRKEGGEGVRQEKSHTHSTLQCSTGCHIQLKIKTRFPRFSFCNLFSIISLSPHLPVNCFLSCHVGLN